MSIVLCTGVCTPESFVTYLQHFSVSPEQQGQLLFQIIGHKSFHCLLVSFEQTIANVQAVI